MPLLPVIGIFIAIFNKILQHQTCAFVLFANASRRIQKIFSGVLDILIEKD